MRRRKIDWKRYIRNERWDGGRKRKRDKKKKNLTHFYYQYQCRAGIPSAWVTMQITSKIRYNSWGRWDWTWRMKENPVNMHAGTGDKGIYVVFSRWVRTCCNKCQLLIIYISIFLNMFCTTKTGFIFMPLLKMCS